MLTIDELLGRIREYSRSLMVMAIGLTLGFIGFVLATQISMIEHAHSSSQASYYLSHDIADLRTQWSQAHPDEVRQRTRKADQMLLRDFDHLTRWFQQMQTHASTMGLHVTYRVRPTRKDVPDLPGIEMVPVDLKVYPETPTILTGAYQKYLKFLRQLSEGQVRMDLQEVEVQGGTGAAHMNVGLHVWMKAAA